MKLAFKLLAVVALLLIAVLVYLALNLGSVIKSGIESYGPDMLETNVSVNSVTLTPWNGNGSINNLVIGQPQGYDTGNAVELGTAAVSVDVSSLSSDVIVINSIIVDSPAINYVQKDLKNSNLKELAATAERKAAALSSGAAAPEPAEEQPAGKPVKVIIDKLVISNVQLSAASPLLLGESVAVTVPDITLTGLGRDNGGATPEQLAKQITEQVTKALTKAIANSSIFQEKIRDVIQSKAKAKIEEKLKDKLGDKGGDLIKGLFNR